MILIFYSHHVFLWFDDVYSWWFNCTCATLLMNVRQKVLNAAWQLQATIQCRILDKRIIVTLLSGHPNGDSQLPNLRTVSFTHSKWRGGSVLSLQIKFFYWNVWFMQLTVLCFSLMNGLKCENTVTAFNRYAIRVICICSAHSVRLQSYAEWIIPSKNLQKFS